MLHYENLIYQLNEITATTIKMLVFNNIYILNFQINDNPAQIQTMRQT